jgi:hypothetical protein
MKLRVPLVAVVLAVSCLPLWAWPRMDDADEQTKLLGGVVTGAIAESAKALEAGDAGKARYPLIAVTMLGVSESDKVTDEVKAAYKAACDKAWAAGTVPDEKAFDGTAKEYGPKFRDAYINALYYAESATSMSSKQMFEYFAKGMSLHPAAEALAIEFSAKALPPEAYLTYSRQGKNSGDASGILTKLADIYGGPWAIGLAVKQTVAPNALDTAADEIGRIDLNNQDPQELAFEAQMVESDRLKWVRFFDAEDAKCKELQAKVDAIKQKARELRAAQVKENRMPPDRYDGDDKAALKAEMARIFELQPGAKVVKVVIPGTQWVEKPFVWVGLNNADAGWYKLLDGAVLCKYADGTFHVHPVTYGRRWVGGDRYGDLEVRGWADEYEILAQYAK